MSGASAEGRRIPAVADLNSALRGRLEKLWETAPGLRGYFSTVDHKEIGKAYLVTSFAFLVLGGLEALVIRLQLARPEENLAGCGKRRWSWSFDRDSIRRD